MKYTFSVIIPVYNLDKYIEEAIECIVEQTIGFRDNIQLILIDDGSTDFSASICKRYVAEYPENITYVFQNNQGVGFARNVGLEFADGKYIVFFDGDDIWGIDAFQKIKTFFDANYDEIDVVTCRTKMFEKSKGYAALDDRFNQGTRIVDVNKTPWTINRSVKASVFKSSAIGSMRFDDQMLYGNDIKFVTLMILQKCKYGLLKEVEYMQRKRMDGSSLSQSLDNNAMKHFHMSGQYYKGMYEYSFNKFDRVLPYIQHLIMSTYRFRVTTPVPKKLSDEQIEQYRENMRWVINNTSDDIILSMKRVLVNTRLYMLWLKYGDELYNNLQFVDGVIYYKDKAIGKKLDGAGILRIDDIQGLSGTTKYYCAVQISAFLPRPQMIIEKNGERMQVELHQAEMRSRLSFQNDKLQQVYTCEIETNYDESLPHCKLLIEDFELSLEPVMPAAKTNKKVYTHNCSEEEYIRKIVDVTGDTYENISLDMQRVRNNLGTTFGEYYYHKMYSLSDPQKARIYRNVRNQQNSRRESYDKVMKNTGMSQEQIDSRISWINKRNIYHVTLNSFAKFELYNYAGKALDKQLWLLSERDRLKAEIQRDFSLIDAGKKTYADIKGKIDEIYKVYDSLIPESIIKKYADRLQYSFPEICANPDKMRYYAADIEFSLYVLGFYVVEYISFRFAEKTLEEKREFISESELIKIYKELHTDSAYDILNDKKSTYNVLGAYYGRDVIKVTGENDRAEFIAFCKSKEMFVFKPVYGSMGKGIGPVYLADYDSEDQVFDDLNSQFGEWVAEGLINQHEVTKALNPDSVNTIRLITYFDGNKTVIHRAFAKIGRAGSFVDNGGSGGIFVSVDHNTGVFTTDGCDENGVIYEKHPETGITFKGYQIPSWEKALELGMKISDKIDGAHYIGWDLALTAEEKWIIVEGNSRTQFVGQQCTTRKGERNDFIDLIYRKQDFFDEYHIKK